MRPPAGPRTAGGCRWGRRSSTCGRCNNLNVQLDPNLIALVAAAVSVIAAIATTLQTWYVRGQTRTTWGQLRVARAQLDLARREERARRMADGGPVFDIEKSYLDERGDARLLLRLSGGPTLSNVRVSVAGNGVRGLALDRGLAAEVVDLESVHFGRPIEVESEYAVRVEFDDYFRERFQSDFVRPEEIRFTVVVYSRDHPESDRVWADQIPIRLEVPQLRRSLIDRIL